MENASATPAPDSPPAPESGEPGFRHVSALHRISALAAGADDPRVALQSILATVADTFGASSGSISLLNPDTGLLEIEVQRGLPDNAGALGLRLGQGITGWVAFHARPQLVPDVSADPRYIRIRPEARCEMAAPLIEVGGQTVGVINLDSDRPGGFSESDLARLVQLAGEATSVMQRIWQLRQLQEKARQLEALIAVGQSLVTKLEPQGLFDSVTRDARQITRTRACALYLYDSAHETLRMASLASHEGVPLVAGAIALDSSLSQGVIRTRKQAEYPNIQSPEFADLSDLPRDPALHSVLSTPLLYENDVIGVLAVFTGELHRFNNDEKRLCAALASLAAVALQNLRLYTRVFQGEASLRKNEQLTTLGLLAAEIAHEIRNPLTVIKLLHGHLGLDFPEGDPRRTDVRVIGEKLDQLESIVTRVLTFTKDPAGLHSRWSVSEMIEDTVVLIRLKLAQSKIQLRFNPPSRPLVIDAHKGQLQQVLLNVLINSTQAMPDGGSIAISVDSVESGGARFAAIDIADSGKGIPENIRDRIFDSFLSGRPDGTGLGLSIAKRILLSHQGDMALVSTSPGGTTMRILLPLPKN